MAGRSFPICRSIAPRPNDGLTIFDQLCLPDVPGLAADARMPAGSGFATSCGLRSVRGFRPSGKRYIRDILAMLPKGQSKTTYSAGLLLTAM